MLRIGLFGVGHLGKIHLKCIRLAEQDLELVGFYDPDPAMARKVAEDTGVPAFDSVEELLAAVDAVDIVTPTPTHHRLAKQALLADKHVFVEKPLTHTLAEAEELIRISHERKLVVQVGHVERFNPAMLALQDRSIDPYFIEAHRLATFNPRGTDVSVVLDLMIHDLDIILSLAKSEVADVRASGVAVVSPTPDIVNARIEFVNGAVANLTASRISLKQMRKIRLFQPDAYISLDLLDKETQIVRMYEADATDIPEEGQAFPLETPKGPRIIHVNQPELGPVNAIQLELETFARSVAAGERAAVSIEDGFKALQLAQRITEVMQEKQDKLPTPQIPQS